MELVAVFLVLTTLVIAVAVVAKRLPRKVLCPRCDQLGQVIRTRPSWSSDRGRELIQTYECPKRHTWEVNVPVH